MNLTFLFLLLLPIGIAVYYMAGRPKTVHSPVEEKEIAPIDTTVETPPVVLAVTPVYEINKIHSVDSDKPFAQLKMASAGKAVDLNESIETTTDTPKKRAPRKKKVTPPTES